MLGVLLFGAFGTGPAHGQRIAKYGADFLAGGVDARPSGWAGRTRDWPTR